MKISSTWLNIAVALWIVTFLNETFFAKVLSVYTFEGNNILHILALSLLFLSIIVIVFELVAFKYTQRTVLIGFLFVCTLLNYFMSSYSVILDKEMIRNIVQTDTSEAFDLLSARLFLSILIFAIAPTIVICSIKITYGTLKDEIIKRIKTTLFFTVLIIVLLFSFSQFFTSFFRTNKEIRSYANPTYFVYSVSKYINEMFEKDEEFKYVTKDVHVVKSKEPKQKLVFLVVGEAARSDHFGLNGYAKQTNPLLEKESVISFTQASSCGTSTAYSVPCMFSDLGRSDFEIKNVSCREYMLNILHKTGKISVLWKDNNSDSKGVASRIEAENTKARTNYCNGECRDVVMLEDVDEYIKKQGDNDILIVLHQMGNHGPLYYKRYPDEFERFTPACKSNQLEECTKEEIANAYDNALLYTDYFLSQVINTLKKYEDKFAVSMVYASDHGQSLGENNIYLHGMPYAIAPKNQKHVGFIVWFGDESFNAIDKNGLKQKADESISHDNLFHTMLGLFEVKTDVYKKSLDLFN